MDEKDEISLGVSPNEAYGGSELTPSHTKDGEERTIYPTFRYSGPVDLDLPEDGEMKIDFRKVSETSSVDESGKHHYECVVQVRSISEVEEDEDEAPAHSYSEAGDALDALMKEREEQD